MGELTNAGSLGDDHIGTEVAFGPNMMFSGVVEEVQHLTDGWMKRRRGSEEAVVPMNTPPRAVIRTSDGRVTTLAHDEPVYVKDEGET